MSGERRIVENFQLYSDDRFIQFIEQNIINSPNNKNKINKINDPVNLYEDTILHYAVFHKRTKLIEFLLQHGANPYKSNKRKQTAMDLAKKNNLTELIEKNVKVEKEKK